LSKFLAAEQYRFELAAADLDEARNGFTVVGITENKGSLRVAFRYLRFLLKSRENITDMHPHRIRKVHAQLPSFVAHLVGTAKGLLPAKIASRVKIVGSMKQLNSLLQEPTNTDTSTIEWLLEREAKYQDTIMNLDLYGFTPEE